MGRLYTLTWLTLTTDKLFMPTWEMMPLQVQCDPLDSVPLYPIRGSPTPAQPYPRAPCPVERR